MFGAFLLLASGVRIQSFFVVVAGPLAAGFLNALNCERDVVLLLGVVIEKHSTSTRPRKLV